MMKTSTSRPIYLFLSLFLSNGIFHEKGITCTTAFLTPAPFLSSSTSTSTSLPPLSSSLYSTTTTTTTSSDSNTANNDPSVSPFPDSLKGCICVVTGASRGIGKGIALELGAAGATVYITGTSTSTSTNDSNTSTNNDNGDTNNKFVTNDDVGGPGTIEQTANEINNMEGTTGIGIPYYCDHSNDDQVKLLFDYIEQKHNRLDILINNVFRVPNGGSKSLFGNFWENESSIETWDAVHTIGLRSHYVSSMYAILLMIKSNKKNKDKDKDDNNNDNKLKQPFIGMISSFGGLCYTFNVAYGVGKAGVDRLTKDISFELTNAKEDIKVMSFYPGVVRTERTEKAVEDGTWDEDVGIPLENAETPRFTGRAIVAVATTADSSSESVAVVDGNDSNDDGIASSSALASSSSITEKKSGSFQVVAELAEEYGFTDENGSQPPSIRSLKFLLPAYGMDEETRKKVPSWLIPNWKLPFFIMANGAPPPSSD